MFYYLFRIFTIIKIIYLIINAQNGVNVIDDGFIAAGSLGASQDQTGSAGNLIMELSYFKSFTLSLHSHSLCVCVRYFR